MSVIAAERVTVVVRPDTSPPKKTTSARQRLNSFENNDDD